MLVSRKRRTLTTLSASRRRCCFWRDAVVSASTGNAARMAAPGQTEAATPLERQATRLLTGIAFLLRPSRASRSPWRPSASPRRRGASRRRASRRSEGGGPSSASTNIRHSRPLPVEGTELLLSAEPGSVRRPLAWSATGLCLGASRALLRADCRARGRTPRRPGDRSRGHCDRPGPGPACMCGRSLGGDTRRTPYPRTSATHRLPQRLMAAIPSQSSTTEWYNSQVGYPHGPSIILREALLISAFHGG